MKIQLLAHRGGMGRAPENTVASFKQALADGADGYEFDICLTQDKQPVLIHVDFNRDNIRKATGCEIPLGELTWEEVQQLTVEASDEPVAHLDDALRFTREHQMPCFIEPKTDVPEVLPIIIERVRHFEVVHLTSILTFYLRKHLLVDAKRLEPRLQTSAILINPMANFLKAATAIDVNRIILGWSGINHFQLYNTFTRTVTQQVEQLRINGIGVEAGFIQTAKDVAWAVSRQKSGGVDSLWVDDIPYIRSCLQEI
ncbi:glycerophosphodiester phosphodiesterase [Candidatus Poribacteria bacterium]|nr:glycerophosphodiester phosphodiesterase [Candidatus Poribacteria bacterium]MYG05230.1 glycerophosphodiester phosphodiesterase [Candidatus Poribacteria bacterium]MYK24451.1 glycerophosphodiester phosphodiesterase [Candidatus Poribacteria bacterium]